MTPPEPLTSVSAWHEFHVRTRSPFFSQMILGGPGIRKRGAPFDHRVRNFGMFCGHVAIERSEMQRLGDRAIEHLKRDPEFLLNLMQQAYTEHTNSVAEWQKSDIQDYAAFDGVSLAGAFEHYVRGLQSFGVYVTLPLFAERYFEEFLKERFAVLFGTDAAFWFGVAVDPVKDGIVLQEEAARLRMAAEGLVSPDSLDHHAEQYGWMANTAFDETYYDAAHYRGLLETNKPDAEEKLRQLTERRDAHRAHFTELLSMLSDNRYLIDIVKTANEAVFFRSYRTEMFYGSSRFNKKLLSTVAKHLGLFDDRDAVWLYSDEIDTLLRNEEKADALLIASRKKTYAFLSEYDGRYHHWDGDIATGTCAVYERTAGNRPEDSTLTGSGTFPGKIEARVVVLHSVKGAHKVRGGEVLVTHATNVNVVPILRKVAAIVTEEGGILSHAAIISRELRIPCVIGVKAATKSLHDGDLVEVDAEKGVVTIRERHPV